MEFTPLLVTAYHQELNKSPVLGLDDHRIFQMLPGMLQWMVILDRPELFQLVYPLSHVGICPRESHFDLAVRFFRCVKTTNNKQISIDSGPLQFDRSNPDFNKLICVFILDYPDVAEDL